MSERGFPPFEELLGVERDRAVLVDPIVLELLFALSASGGERAVLYDRGCVRPSPEPVDVETVGPFVDVLEWWKVFNADCARPLSTLDSLTPPVVYLVVEPYLLASYDALCAIRSAPLPFHTPLLWCLDSEEVPLYRDGPFDDTCPFGRLELLL